MCRIFSKFSTYYKIGIIASESCSTSLLRVMEKIGNLGRRGDVFATKASPLKDLYLSPTSSPSTSTFYFTCFGAGVAKSLADHFSPPDFIPMAASAWPYPPSSNAGAEAPMLAD
jgi:hypothetical protein